MVKLVKYLVFALSIGLTCYNFCFQNVKTVEAKNYSDNNVTRSTEFNLADVSSKNFQSDAKNVMFVAHPDDETLWGGNGLYKDKYLVVCITCGVDARRVEEFKKVMDVTGDDYMMLSYPDLVDGKRSRWDDEWDAISSDIDKILGLKEWDLIVTHNPDGEYGHIHHKMTNKLVTIYADKSKLYFFGRFHYGKIPNADKLYRLTDEEFAFKKDKVLPLYVSQYNTIRALSNMIHYESWISYEEWYDE